MATLSKKHIKLLNELKKHTYFIKGSINDYCAKCHRATCICKIETKLRSYRLTYKDNDQKTKVIYVPRERVSEIKEMLINYSNVKRIMDELFVLNVEKFKNSG